MRRALSAALVLCAACAAAPSGAAAPAPKCPIATKAAVMWAFSATGGGTFLHGRGTFTPARATGSACQRRSGADLVIAVHGRGSLARGITRGGVLGAQLVLPVRVTAADASGCGAGAGGTLTLFTSYNATHRDAVKLQLHGGCPSRALSGALVHVSIPH